MPNVLIDGRGMLPPEPLERAVSALALLQDDEELTLLLSRRPYPLFPILSVGGYRWSEAEESGGGFRYRIFKR